jgi:signal transduction histidine kinase
MRNKTKYMDAPGHSIIVPIDGLHLQRAVINLIDNSIEASPKGQSVVLSTWTDKDHAVIKLKDHGSGMDKETLENIFVPFYSKRNRGTGLGMAIAKKLVDGHHGKIQVKSRPGLGTEVMIALPCKENKV